MTGDWITPAISIGGSIIVLILGKLLDNFLHRNQDAADAAKTNVDTALTLMETLKADVVRLNTDLVQVRGNLEAERKRNETNTQLIIAANARIDELVRSVEDYQALADARGEQVRGFGGTPVTLDEVKKKRTTRQRITLENDDEQDTRRVA